MATIGFDETRFNNLFLPAYNHQGWEMTPSEKLIFVHLVEQTRPKIALEIGSRAGGSLQVLNKICDTVYCVDIDTTIPERLSEKYPKTEFYIGDSASVLPKLYQHFLEESKFPNFIHIDGDHTEAGAFRDLDSTLSIRPPHDVLILMHDTFNPTVRRGILKVDFNSKAHLHYADLDFVPGILHERPAVKDEMWGGISLFLLKNEPRNGDLRVNQFLNRMINQVSKISSHI